MYSSWNVFRARGLLPSLSHYSKCSTRLTIASTCIHEQRRGLEILIDPRKLGPQTKKKERTKSARPSYRFVDRARIRVSGGTGGKGSLSMQKLKRKHRLRPDGGHGGNGGSVVIIADPNEQSLKWSHPHIQAENGTNGSSNEKFGRNGKNLMLRVPCGVVVKRVLDYDEEWDPESGEITKTSWMQGDDEERQESYDYSDSSSESSDDINSDADTDLSDTDLSDTDLSDTDLSEVESDSEGDMVEHEWMDEEASSFNERETVVLGDLDEPGSHILVAKGGRGGYGSCLYGSDHGPLPDAREMIKNSKPLPGETVFLELELKLIADIGLVGYPNAGKSSLLAAMSRASPEIAPYPFTTLYPMVGYIEYHDGFRLRAADIPGLIEGASQGRGCGFEFLRHIERTKALLYIVDAAGVDYRDPVDDLRTLVDEIGSYGDGSLLQRQALVVANKLDLIPTDQQPAILSKIKTAADELELLNDNGVLGISAGVSGLGLPELAGAMRKIAETNTGSPTHL